jgi:acyl-CoA hydrolase
MIIRQVNAVTQVASDPSSVHVSYVNYEMVRNAINQTLTSSEHLPQLLTQLADDLKLKANSSSHDNLTFDVLCYIFSHITNPLYEIDKLFFDYGSKARSSPSNP